MSTRCDSCKQILDEEDGCARLVVRDPSPDYSAVDIPPPVIRRAPQIDICAVCLVKLIEVLDLPADTFRPRPKRVAPAGALSEADLAELGLKDKSV